jgi:hypothetical protein
VPLNAFLEKVFVFLWFWFICLTILNLTTLVTWSANTVCACAPFFFTRKFMKSNSKGNFSQLDNPYNATQAFADSRANGGAMETDEEESLSKHLCVSSCVSQTAAEHHNGHCTTRLDTSILRRKFISDYLRGDGMMVLWMVAANTDTVLVKELVRCLWDNFQDHHHDVHGDDDGDGSHTAHSVELNMQAHENDAQMIAGNKSGPVNVPGTKNSLGKVNDGETPSGNEEPRGVVL